MTLKTFAWIGGGLITLALVLYAVAVGVNWRDQPPSPQALRFAASYAGRPALADDNNAFVYLLGFGAALGENSR